MISDALDEIDINGAISKVFPQRYDQGRISGRALPVKFNKNPSDPKAWRFGGGFGKLFEQVLKTMSAGKIIIMNLDGTINATAWGGLVSKLAQKKVSWEQLCMEHAGMWKKFENLVIQLGQKAFAQEEAVMILHLEQLMNQF